MNTTLVYDQLIDELNLGELEHLERRVFEILKANPGGVTRSELVYLVYGARVQDLAGSTQDRKIRKAIESLRGRLVPIVSSSGEAGYRLDTSREAIEKMMSEWRSRIERLQERLNAAAKFYRMPEFYAPAEKSSQPSLF